MTIRKLLPRSLVLLCLCWITPAMAQTDLAQLLSDKKAPLTVKVKDLDATWRKVNLGDSDNSLIMQAMMHMATNATDIYLTQGKTASVGDQTYLVAYHLVSDRPARVTRMGRRTAPAGPAATKLPPDGILRLSLLNLHTLGSMDRVTAFDPKTDVETEADRDMRVNEASVSNLRQIGLGLMQYTQDYDEKLPDMHSAQSMAQIRQQTNNPKFVQQRLFPYVRTHEIFVHPKTKQIYRTNLKLSGKILSEISNPSATPTFWEASPGTDGLRAVLYLDGHVARVTEANWALIRSRNGIK